MTTDNVRKPRLLLVAFEYPPRYSAGSIRPAGLAKYLQRLGWDVTVLTPADPRRSPNSTNVLETEYRSVIAEWKSRFGIDPQRPVHDQLGLPQSSAPNSSHWYTKLMAFVRELIAFPDEHKAWVQLADGALSRVPRGQEPDIIVSTSPPASCHLIAALAARRFGCPWVADFRDLWAHNMWGTRALLQPWHRRLEKKTLRTASALVSVSAPWARVLQESYPNKLVYTVCNGFDPEQFRQESVALTAQFTITHTGYLYEGKRDPTPLFEVLREMFAQGELQRRDVKVRFYGVAEPWLKRMVASYQLGDVVEVAGLVPRQEALRRQAESQILLVLGWSDPRETGQHTGKIFEYFGSKRPILAVGGARGALTDLLDETKAGVHTRTREELRAYLRSAYREFSRSGSVTYGADLAAVARYTHLEMANAYSRILQSIIGQPLSESVVSESSHCMGITSFSSPPLVTHSSSELK